MDTPARYRAMSVDDLERAWLDFVLEQKLAVVPFATLEVFRRLRVYEKNERLRSYTGVIPGESPEAYTERTGIKMGQQCACGRSGCTGHGI